MPGNKPPVRPKLDALILITSQILEEDKARIKKQRHTAKRIHARLRGEHGFTGCFYHRHRLCLREEKAGRSFSLLLGHAPNIEPKCPAFSRYDLIANVSAIGSPDTRQQEVSNDISVLDREIRAVKPVSTCVR